MKDGNDSRLRMILSQNLTSFVRQSGQSQAQIAAATGISASALSSYCNGVRYPGPAPLNALASFFHTTVGALTDDGSSRNRSQQEFSREAYWVAQSFEELDDYGRELVRMVVENELRRFLDQEKQRHGGRADLDHADTFKRGAP